jgi:hypothetical protein
VAALDVERPTRLREPEDQTTRAVFVAGVVFNHLACRERFAKLLDADVPKDTLVQSVLGELEVSRRDPVPNSLNQLHAVHGSQAKNRGQEQTVSEAARD